jgi:hypothetical protein
MACRLDRHLHRSRRFATALVLFRPVFKNDLTRRSASGLSGPGTVKRPLMRRCRGV